MKTNEHFAGEEQDFTTEEKLKYGLLAVVVLGGSFFLGRTIIRKARASSEERKTFEEGTPATYAKQLKMAFDNNMWMGWGTDEKAIRQVMQAVSTKEAFRQVMISYQKLYNTPLMKDLQEELTSSEYNEMLAILSAKPENGNEASSFQSRDQYLSWAKRLRAAFEQTYGWFPGTDEAAIESVFIEIPSKAAFKEVGKMYQAEYGKDLLSDLRSELEFWEYGSMMKIIKDKA